MVKRPRGNDGTAQRFKCPDCNHPIRITHTVRSGSPLLREKYYQCTNVQQCGHTFKGHEEITMRISAGQLLNPAIDLPFSKPQNQEG